MRGVIHSGESQPRRARTGIVALLVLITVSCAPRPDPATTSVRAEPSTAAPELGTTSPQAGQELESRGECGAGLPNLAAGRSVTASATAPGHPGENAVDGDSGTWWSAGRPPLQWIEIDLGEPTAVRCVRLLTEQAAAGPTVHRVNGGAHVDPGRELATIDSATGPLQWLQIEGEWEFRFLRVTTQESPSVVSWREIVVR